MRPPRASVGARARGGIRRGAYLLPSLFTMGNMVLGFYAIVCGLDGTFRKAALMVFAAAFLDSIDGRIARMTGTESEFGKEYDSLADVVTFGVAPGMLAYLWGLREFSRDAWLLSVFFMVCTATRLARFNVQTKVTDSRYFVGLPSPAAAGTICSILIFAPEYTDDLRPVMQAIIGMALLVVGALMVSTFRYNSFKTFDLRKRWSYRAFVPFAALLLVFVFIPRATLLAITVTYTLSAPLGAVFSRLRPARGPRAEELPPPPPVEGAL
ncbi:MAG TPA: CDP-diacylglycerol--serine O-phosphatidyltransferase [Thermoanaerobaculia bacterium]|nr:CDP-diacylglycerol--serine O-phosphatidyltransferase [Thermoanaerobaculia bacterium]